jgi:hypothetical protein
MHTPSVCYSVDGKTKKEGQLAEEEVLNVRISCIIGLRSHILVA